VYKPNDSRPDRSKERIHGLAALTGLVLITATGILLQLPAGAAAGMASAKSQKTQGTYQLRCWQYGRLLFDEGPVTLGAEARQGARLVAIDRHGAALIVTDTGGTTCLARPSAAPPNLALPR
jgi:hypothetical protein